MTDLVSQMLAGDRLALTRLISKVESRSPDVLSIMSQVQEKCGQTWCIGITGPPGAGKSTLTDKVISQYRQQGKKVGVVAIDPSSPFSGGAVLGDRIRMQDHAGDDGVFIRSLGSRGSHGGLSRATREVVKLFDAYGMDVVIVETVGVGQTELDIMEIANTTIVVLTPESGDAIQTLKAGIMEIADIFVVNKADRDGSLLMQTELKAMLELGAKRSKWELPVLLVQAYKNIGVDELVKSVSQHREFLNQSESQIKHNRALSEVKEIIQEEVMKLIQTEVEQLKSQPITNPYLEAISIVKKLTPQK
ncbi:MAG: methylmalonyl Co-A mutase-associated GTPase MeaB [Deltaproteobacteria bacterium]|nr:MAG: methylmalonyl Co-A mutase-associated GTPase MeaB [Deltaproteobacteria bacterium]